MNKPAWVYIAAAGVHTWLCDSFHRCGLFNCAYWTQLLITIHAPVISYTASPMVWQSCHFICIEDHEFKPLALYVSWSGQYIVQVYTYQENWAATVQTVHFVPITVHVVGYSPLLSVQINESAISVNPNTLSVCSLYCILCTGCRQLSTNYQQFTL